MFDPATSPVSRNAISSPGLASGRTHFVPPAGQMIDLFGPVPVLANLSARQAKELGLLTSGTSGQLLGTSSRSASLQSSLESRLRVKTLMYGSTLYTLTWKPWVTPSGVSRSRLRASVRRTSETGTTGWPTPTVSNDRAGNEQSALSMKREDGSKVQQRLQDFALLTGWATPSARDWHSASASAEFLAKRLEQTRGKPLSEQAFVLAGWATPTANQPGGTPEAHMQRKLNMGRKTATITDLGMQVSAWTKDSPARLTATGLMLTGSDAQMESGGQLRPEFSRWLMGIPPEWDHCAPESKPKLRKP